MPPRRSRLAFPKSVMDKGFTSLPNALDDLGLGPYHYRVLVFIIRWKGKATPDKPFFGISVEYIARMTCISVSKVKDVIHDLEHEHHLIAVHRRKRLRNLYDIRPLFAALLRNQARPKEQASDPTPISTAAEAVVDGGEDAEVPDGDVEDEREREDEQAGPWLPHPRFGKPRYDVAQTDQREDGDKDFFEEPPTAVRPPRRPGFGKPSYAAADSTLPGMDDDPTYEEQRQEEEFRQACNRGYPDKCLLLDVRYALFVLLVRKYERAFPYLWMNRLRRAADEFVKTLSDQDLAQHVRKARADAGGDLSPEELAAKVWAYVQDDFGLHALRVLRECRDQVRQRSPASGADDSPTPS